MEKMVIRGGRPLRGTVAVAGSKNAALPIMAAAILTDEPIQLEDVPRLADVETLARVLEGLGVSCARLPNGSLRLETRDAQQCEPDADLVRRMRASFCVLGPLVARRGYAKVALPGGCRIGDRPIDLHLKGLQALGAEITVQGDSVVARADRLVGTTIDLRGPAGTTVTGTCNVMTAAVLASGDTRIEGAAREPEVADLGRFLCSLGAEIDGLGTSHIHIRGVKELAGADYRIIPDRIEAATLMTAAAITRSDLTIINVRRSHLAAVIAKLRQIGVTIDGDRDRLRVHGDRPFRGTDLDAVPYPGIPTDTQAQFTALLATANGSSAIRDLVFPDRFHHLNELRRMGAVIERQANVAKVRGVPNLHGAEVTASDLRASAALVLAALAARGETVIQQIAHLDRGYEQLDAKLRLLGADIRRVSENEIRRAA